jgi:hypothetical protein
MEDDPVRRIENQCLLTMKSPARHLFGNLHRAIVNLARERDEEFDKELDEFTLQYCDNHLWILNVNVPDRTIRISRKVVEVLWSSAYAYFVVYNDVIRHQNRTKQVMVDLTADARVKQSCELLRWAYESWLNRSEAEWPSDLPMPTENPPLASDQHVADELALGGLAFMLHHELAHIRLQHVGKSGVEQERESDNAAIDWVFGKTDRSDTKLVNKKALCCAVGLAVLCAYGVHTGLFGGITHPPSYDRLVHGLSRALEGDDCHLAWFFVTAMIRHTPASRTWLTNSPPEGPPREDNP